MPKGRFVYRGGNRTTEEVVRKSKQSGGMFDSWLISDVNMYKPSQGECSIRIMPASWDKSLDEKWGVGWEIAVWMHYNVGPDNNAYLCLAKMLEEPCPVCEARAAATDEDEAYALKVGYRALSWVIDRDNEKAGPLIFSMPLTLFKEVNARSVDKKSNAVIQVDNPEDGYDVTFTREGEKLRTKYTAVEVARDPTPLSENQKLFDRWLEYIQGFPLPDVLVFYPPEHIEKVLFGQGRAKKKDDEDEDEQPKRSRPSRSRRDEEEEEEEEPKRSTRRTGRSKADEEEEEEEETPKRTARTRLKAEPEEEEEQPKSRRKPVEEEEEEDTPKRSSRRAAEPEEEEEEEERPSASAKKQLERLKSRRG